jgi:sulfate adenylyltransferase subunit 1
MDLVDYDEKIYKDLRRQYLEKTKSLKFDNVTFVPISALEGVNIVKNDNKIPWYKGSGILGYLKIVKEKNADKSRSRLQVQNVVKDDPKRYYQGFVSSGTFAVKDQVKIYPTDKTATITNIIHSEKKVKKVAANDSILFELDQDLDLDRGGLVSDLAHIPKFANSFNADLIWFSEEEFKKGDKREMLIKLNHNYVRASIKKINHLIDVNDLAGHKAVKIEQNQITNIDLSLAENLAFDSFHHNRKTGAFLLIDKNTNETLGCGIITSNNQSSSKGLSFFSKLFKKAA